VPKGKTFRGLLEKLRACQTAMDWVGKKSLKTAWNTCQEPTWMWWLIENVDNISDQAVIEASYDCVMAILQYANKDDFDALFELTERARKTFTYKDCNKLKESNLFKRPPQYIGVELEVLKSVRYLCHIRNEPTFQRSVWHAGMISVFPENTYLNHLKADFADNIRRRIPYRMVKAGLSPINKCSECKAFLEEEIMNAQEGQ
jgi:hypothetical protein